jgi:hypothetical protein
MIVLAHHPVCASEVAVPLYQPTTIDVSGSYRVTRDISSYSGAVFTINAPKVVIDLDGHEIKGGVGVALAAGAQELRIHDGRISANAGIEGLALGTVTVRVEDIGFTHFNNFRAIHLEADNPTLRVARVEMLERVYRGIEVQALSVSTGSVTIVDSTFGPTRYGAVYIAHTSSVRFARNTISDDSSELHTAVGLQGIAGATAIVEDNTITLNGGAGTGLAVSYFASAVVEGNAVRAPDTGLHVWTHEGARIVGNDVHGAETCIAVKEWTLVADNVATGCTTGLSTSYANNVYRNNVIEATTPVTAGFHDGGGNFTN